MSLESDFFDRLAADGRFKGPPGPPGETGERGPYGPRGEAGTP